MPRGRAANVGEERMSPNGYMYRKLGDGRWETIHRIIAEEKLGRPLSVNEYATFLDNNRTNLEPSNIIVLQRGAKSLRKRLANVEEQIKQLTKVKNELTERLRIQGELLGE